MRRVLVGIAVAVLVSGSLWAQMDEETLAELRDTIEFGIDEEVRGVVDRLEDEDIAELNEALLSRYEESFNAGLKQRIMEFFNAVAFQGAAETAVSLVRDFRATNTELVTTAIRLLRNEEIELPENAVQALLEAAQRGSGGVVRESIRTLGAREIAEAEELLIERLQDRRTDQATKEAAVLALGAVGTSESVGTLLSVAQNAQAGSLYRGYAIQSLGEIGVRDAAEQVTPPLRRFMTANDAIVRSYATEALLAVDQENRQEVLSGALRDSLAQTRLNALQWIRENKVADMSRAVQYKVTNDPDPRVRARAMETLAVLDTENYGELLAEIALDVSKPTDDRMSAMKTLIEEQPVFAVEAFREAVREDLREEPQPVAMPLAQVLSEVGGDAAGPLYETLLTAGDYRVRLYALAGIERNEIAGLNDTLRELQGRAGIHPAAAQTLERILGPPKENDAEGAGEGNGEGDPEGE
jgi:hypothetical protein